MSSGSYGNSNYGNYTIKVDLGAPPVPHVDVAALLQEAQRLHYSGSIAEAEARYRKVLAADPKNADALHFLGLIAFRARRYDAAAQLIGQSVAVAPDNAESHNNLGNALAMLKRPAEAQAAYRRALELDPQQADAAFNLGNALREGRQYAEAEAMYARALAVDPNHASALANLANLYALQRRVPDAARAFGELGNLLQDLGRTDDAANAYRQSLALEPNPGIEVQRAFLMPVIAASSEEIDQTRDRLVAGMATMQSAALRLADPVRYASPALFYTAYQGRNDRALKQGFADFYLSAAPELAWSAPHCTGYAGPEAKVRVGFVSKFLTDEHPIGKYYSAVIDRLDRSRFEVVEFRVAGARDVAAPGRSQVLVSRDDLASARAEIAAARLDALFYPEVGMDPATYFLAMSRLAPVQCTTLGHPVTTGIATVDYFLSADSLELPDAADHYTETLIRFSDIPNYFRQRAPGGVAATRAEFGLPADRRVYVCGQNPIKIHPDFDATLGEILRRDPDALLVLFHGDKTPLWGEKLMQRFRRTMPDVASRVMFVPFLTIDAYLGLLALADAVLDTPHFAGGTTSLEAFACGVPIVTWPGAYARSRQTQALYRRMGIDGPIAETAEQYVLLALQQLAQDPVWRNTLRHQLREQASVLYENRGVIGELEAFLVAAVAAARDGRKVAQWPQ